MILKPLITEKTAQTEKEGTYTFLVPKDATKIDVKNAIRALYGVDATKVNMLYRARKTKLAGGRGLTVTKRRKVKKAIVTLKGRKTIDVYKITAQKA